MTRSTADSAEIDILIGHRIICGQDSRTPTVVRRNSVLQAYLELTAEQATDISAVAHSILRQINDDWPIGWLIPDRATTGIHKRVAIVRIRAI